MNPWLDAPKDISEFKVWCRVALRELRGFLQEAQHDGFDALAVAESSESLVEQAGLIALDLGLPDLYRTCSQADDAIACLGQCLKACEPTRRETPLLVDAKEAAALCGISPASWYRYRAAGKTPAPVKLGGRVLYRVVDLQQWIARGCRR